MTPAEPARAANPPAADATDRSLKRNVRASEHTDTRLDLSDIAGRSVVLLGERHNSEEHHRWQLHTAAALHAHNPEMVLGFEMFPRRSQPVLDAWVAGELTESEFLKQVRWDDVWGYPAEFYLPLLHFARQNRVPVVALNVDRQLVARVGREGWDAVPVDEREGVSRPAAAVTAYRRDLARVYAYKSLTDWRPGAAGDSIPEPTEADIDAALADPGFSRFVEAQLVWDRAMAEAAAAAHSQSGVSLVVGFVGRGHVEHGWGVPHQLADLGVDQVAVLLPVDGGDACDAVAPGEADGVFVIDVPEEPETPRLRLGVMLEPGDGNGVRILDIVSGSVAAAAGLKTGDVILRAADVAVTNHRDLRAVIRRQAPGTWLPLVVERGGETLNAIAKFPAGAESKS